MNIRKLFQFGSVETILEQADENKGRVLRVRLLAFLVVLVITMVLGVGAILLATDSTHLILVCTALLFLGLFVSFFISKMYIDQITMVFSAVTEARRAAEAATRTKSEFLAKMSHEIRTPMNAITGMAELALREDMPDTVREHILTIKQAGANLLSIINDILDFSKIESGKLEIVPTEYSFSFLINDVISIIRTRVIDLQIRFVAYIDCNIPDALFGDEIRVRQIFLNILSNAVKYTEKGFVSLAVTGEISGETVNLVIEVADSGRGIQQKNMEKLFSEFVQFDLGSNKGIEGTGLGLAITRNLINAMNGDISVVSEYGRGSTFTVTLPQEIHSPEKLALVENPAGKNVLLFERREIYVDSILRALDNLGVHCTHVCSNEEFGEKMESGTWPFVFIAFGLFESVSDILEKHDSQIKIVLLAKFGEVLADKNLQILTMPAYSVSIANALNGINTGFVSGTYTEAVLGFIAPEARILVVDDIDTNLKVAEGLLLPYKMQVELCSSGLKAIEAVKQRDYDIVFMDHMMPEMDGIQATAAIRAWEREDQQNNTGNVCRRMPIIALTANAVSGMKEMFVKNGFNDFLAKPIDVTRLEELIDRWIPKEKKQRVDTRERVTDTCSLLIPAAIPGIDMHHGVKMTGGKVAGYRGVLSVFYKDTLERLPVLQTTPAADALDEFVIHVHALKSASASIGAEKISNEAAALESAGKTGNLAELDKQLPVFAENLAELVKNIGKALGISDDMGQREIAPPVIPAATAPNLVPLLHELVAALKSRKVHEIDLIIRQLHELPLDTGKESGVITKLVEISDYVLMAEFESAAEAVQTLLEGAFHGN